MQKCPRNCTMNKKSSNFEKKMGLNCKLKGRKSLKSILSGAFGDLYGRVGDQCPIWETSG